MSGSVNRRRVCSSSVINLSGAVKSSTVVDKADAWLREQTLGQLFAKDELKKLLKEIDQDEKFWVKQRPKFESIFKEVEGHLRQEQRPLGSILRPSLKAQLLEQIEASDLDSDVVKAFMRTPAVEAMTGSILYTVILDFLQRADVLGGIVDSLPIVGPIRQEVNRALKEAVDRSAGGLIREFLGTRSRPAVEQMIQFVLAPENRRAFGRSGRRLAEYVMARPVASLLPSPAASLALRDQLWAALRESAGTVADEEALLESFFAKLGDRPVGTFLPELPVTAKDGLLKIWQKFLDSEDGIGLGLSDRPSTTSRGRERIREFE